MSKERQANESFSYCLTQQWKTSTGRTVIGRVVCSSDTLHHGMVKVSRITPIRMACCLCPLKSSALRNLSSNVGSTSCKCRHEPIKRPY